MALEQTPIRPIQVNYKCDVCNVGCYYPASDKITEFAVLSEPMLYKHKCNNPECNDIRDFKNVYPMIRYAWEGQLLNLEIIDP